MRRLPLLALSSAALSAALLTGVVDSATAAKPPSFTGQNIGVGPNATEDRCVVTVGWSVSDPSAVEGYLVQANNTPLKGKNTVQGNVITETSSNWEIDDDSAFYIKVTMILTGGKESKSFSVGNDRWDCIG